MVPTVVPISKAIRLVLTNATSAGDRVQAHSLPQNPTFPFVTYYRNGGLVDTGDNRVEGGRWAFEAWGNTDAEALRVAQEIRGIWLPASRIVGGFVGDVSWASEGSNPSGVVHFNGAWQEAGPTWVPDPETQQPRYTISFMLMYS